MSPVEPTLTFEIPSLHDGVQLECRVYHPPILGTDQTTWLNTASIVAHPYAPLGGCYNVPVVLDVVKALLKENVTVGTFNFRGAGASKGRTSWTGRSEVKDYESFIIFLLFYLTFLRREFDHNDRASNGVDSQIDSPTPVKEHHEPDTASSILRLVFAGYSYGSLIVTHLPLADDIVRNSVHLPLARYANDIVVMARSLAAKTAEVFLKHNHRGSHIRVGSGHEISHSPSHTGRHRADMFKHLPHPTRGKDSRPIANSESDILTLPTIPRVEPHYLLVSPILPPLSYTVMLPLGHTHQSEAVWERYSAFAIFGDCDGFTSIKKLIPWAKALASTKEPDFQYALVIGAGHFWIEEGVAEKLKSAVGGWVRLTVLPPSNKPE